VEVPLPVGLVNLLLTAALKLAFPLPWWIRRERLYVEVPQASWRLRKETVQAARYIGQGLSVTSITCNDDRLRCSTLTRNSFLLSGSEVELLEFDKCISLQSVSGLPHQPARSRLEFDKASKKKTQPLQHRFRCLYFLWFVWNIAQPTAIHDRRVRSLHLRPARVELHGRWVACRTK